MKSGFGATAGGDSIVATPFGNGYLDGLVAYWPGNEASGDLLDASLSGAHMTAYNGPLAADGFVYATARDYNRQSLQEHKLSGNYQIHRLTNWTLAQWVYYTNNTERQVSWENSGVSGITTQIGLSHFGAKRISFLVWDSAGGYQAPVANNYGDVATGQWVSILATFDNGAMGISVNNSTPNTATLSTTARISPSATVQKICVPGGTVTSMRIGPTALWNRQLTIAERAAWTSGMPYSAMQYSTQPQYDLWLIAGQSNASGRGINNQVWQHASLLPMMFDNSYQWKLLIDPVDRYGQTDTVSGDNEVYMGSVWPLVASQLMATTSRAQAFVPCAKGGSSITSWLPGADHYNRSTLYGSMAYRATQARAQAGMTLRGVLWWQGETDALADMTAATYNGHLDTIANAVASDLGVPLIPCKLQNCSGLTAGQMAEINNAIAAAWADNANVVAGPDLTGIATDDTFHLTADAKLLSAATLWHNAIVASEIV